MNWSDAKININSLDIHYYRSSREASGKAGPAVVMAHGITDSGRTWDSLAEVLEKSFDVLSLDARGHGFSDKPEHGYGSRDHAEDLIALIGALELGHPALIGHSMGADNVAMLAHLEPGLPRCLVLEDPPWRASGKERDTGERAEQWKEEILLRQSHSREEVIAEGRELHPGWRDEEYGPWADSKLQVTARVMQYLTRRTPWVTMVRSIRCPTLLVTGEPEREAIVTRETAEEICRMNEAFEWVRIEGAGHIIHRDRFEPYCEAVMEFLSRHK